MPIQKLYTNLTEAYSDKNLNLISSKLINLYKNKNYSKIREIANKISKFVSINEEKDARCFSKLIMLYHPDKGSYYRKCIKEYFTQKDTEKLKQLSHILLLNNIEAEVVCYVDEDIDYHPEYAWDDIYGDSYQDFLSDEAVPQEVQYEGDFDRSFYNAIKLREYGRIDIEFPNYYLEDFEDFELSYSGIDLLDGVEFCIHATSIDISNNEICDLSKLWDLQKIEELFAANNQIGYIDTLSNLLSLKTLDLSGNQIDDISPLFSLKHLEYVNLMGNPIPKEQIQKLEEIAELVIF